MYRLTALLLMTFLAVSAAQAGKTYTWVDEKGVTHFSTRPPPSEHTDSTRLKGGSVNKPPPDSETGELAKIKKVDLQNSGWKGCASSLCKLVQQFDPGCKTSYCSRAKRYSEKCRTAGCLTKKIAFEKEVQDRIAAKNELRQQQAINANTTPTPPPPRNQN
jgi:hypothetical protein